MKDKLRADILSRYCKLKEELGHKPSSSEFLRLSGITRRNLQETFGNSYYSKLVKESGDEPNIFYKPGKSTNDLLILWGTMVRKLGRIPTESDWRFNKFEPSPDWYRKKFEGLPKIPEKFQEFAKGKKEWEDVLALLPQPTLEQVEIKSNMVAESESDGKDIYQFLPSVLNNLYDLGYSEGKNIEFEKKVNLAFQTLGFKVKFLGQGSGRNPDGIAYDSQNHYAIIYDAKARKDGYGLGTDDRTIIEYINAYKSNLLKDGYEKVYFLIVANKFNVFSKTNLNRIIKETGVPVILLKTEDLLTLVSKSIKNRALFDLGELQDLFIESGELDKKKVDRFAD